MFPRFAPLVAVAVLATVSGCATAPDSGPDHVTSSAPAVSSAAPTSVIPTPTHAAAPAGPPVLAEHSRQVPTLPSSHAPASTTPARKAPTSGGLPLSYSTGSATQVLTVTATSTSTTHATLQAWVKTSAGAWVKHGGSIGAHVGRGGMTNSMSEYVAETPMGSFGLTQAFGRNSNPGTGLPYFKTTPADWWISQSLPTYNTHQRCTSGTDGNGCGYKSPSEHLYYTSVYSYAVVIDYNTSSPVYPRGSAVFLHVTDGGATAGCVSIPQSDLVSVMRWLNPADHPRILIGLA